MSYSFIKQKLSANEPVLMDGGNGTEVLRRGVRWRQHGIEDAPDVIREIHMSAHIPLFMSWGMSSTT